MRSRDFYAHYTSSVRGSSKVKLFIALYDANEYTSAFDLWPWCCISLSDLRALLCRYRGMRYLKARHVRTRSGGKIWTYKLDRKGIWWLTHKPPPGRPLRGGAKFNLDKVRANMQRFHNDVVIVLSQIKDELPAFISESDKIEKIEEYMRNTKPWEKKEIGK